MIGRLVGRIVEESADGTVVLDVHGVGYEVTVPLGSVGRATPDAEGAVSAPAVSTRGSAAPASARVQGVMVRPPRRGLRAIGGW